MEHSVPLESLILETTKLVVAPEVDFASIHIQPLRVQHRHNVEQKTMQRKLEVAELKKTIGEVQALEATKYIIDGLKPDVNCGWPSVHYNLSSEGLLSVLCPAGNAVILQPDAAQQAYDLRSQINTVVVPHSSLVDIAYLCVTYLPVLDEDVNCCGVIQLVKLVKKGVENAAVESKSDRCPIPSSNSNGQNPSNTTIITSKSEFSAHALSLWQGFARLTSLSLDNSLWAKHITKVSARYHSLVEMIIELQEEQDFTKFMVVICRKVCRQIGADRCTVYIYDENRQELWSRVASGLNAVQEIRVKISEGLAGACARDKQLININDVYGDPRFNAAYDLKTGYRSKACLAVPLFEDSEKRRFRGVIQCMNKVISPEADFHNDAFDEEDEEQISFIAKVVGVALHKAVQLLNMEEKILQYEQLLGISNDGLGLG
jgi:hypothetical protein